MWIKRKYGLQEIREIEHLMQHSEKEHFPTFIQFVIVFALQLFDRQNIFIYNYFFLQFDKMNKQINTIINKSYLLPAWMASPEIR